MILQEDTAFPMVPVLEHTEFPMVVIADRHRVSDGRRLWNTPRFRWSGVIKRVDSTKEETDTVFPMVSAR